MIHLSADRRVTSIPLTHGRSTSELLRPFGFGSCSQSRARSPDVEGPALGVAHERRAGIFAKADSLGQVEGGARQVRVHNGDRLPIQADGERRSGRAEADQ